MDRVRTRALLIAETGQRVGPGARFRAALSWAALGVLVLVCAVGGYLHVARGFSASAVLSDSMRPSYRAGDLMITRLVPVSELHVGEVVVLTPPGESAPVAHRIVAISGNPAWPTLRTKGDANPAPDRWLEKPVRGRAPVAVARVPFLGIPRRVFDSARARVALVALIGAGLTGWATRQFLRTERGQVAPTRSGGAPVPGSHRAVKASLGATGAQPPESGADLAWPAQQPFADMRIELT